MPKLRGADIGDRLYARDRGNGQPPRYWADFREFADVGGRQEALCLPGERHATTDLDTARTLAGVRLAELIEMRANTPSVGKAVTGTIAGLAEKHIALKLQTKSVGQQWANAIQVHLERAGEFFGFDTSLRLIKPAHVDEFTVWLLQYPNGRGEDETLSTGSVIQHLNSLSSLINRAISYGLLPMGANPVKYALDRPTVTRLETPFLEIDEMAAALRVAFDRTAFPRPDLIALCFGEVVATIALTGARKAEVLGLEQGDVNLERGIITLKPNDYRRLKTATSERVLTIFPQLGEILLAYKEGPNAPTGRLFFPSLIDPDRMIGDMRKSFDRLPVPQRLRFPSPGDGVPGALPPMRSKWLRHTYCAARLQCIDHDRPISLTGGLPALEARCAGPR